MCVACGGAAPAVTVVQRTPAAPPPVEKTLLGGCRIDGTGERAREGEGVPFEVFASNDAREPAFAIRHPQITHVVWSSFPERADDGRTRARVGLGGQSRVRYDGYADLYGRTFTTRARMDSDGGHLFVSAGTPIDIMAATGAGEVFARAATPFAEPKAIVVEGNCADVLYTPDAQPIARAPSATGVWRGTTFRLFATPLSGHPFTTITPAEPLALELGERREDMVRVTGRAGYVGLDAWVPVTEAVASDVVRRPAVELPRESPQREASEGLRARVRLDTPLLVGDVPNELHGAFVERDAPVVVDARAAVTVSGHDVVAFDFADGFITPPEGARFWIAMDALVRATN